MSTNSKIDDSQEVDFSAVSKGIGRMLGRLNSFIYRCIRFAIRNSILLGILIVVGAALGTWLDSEQKGTYNTQIIVAPNFGSTDYLYSKIELLHSKIADGDTIFLKQIGIKNPDDLSEIRITPIIDIFKFVSSGSDQNFRLLELMSQDGDIKKIVTDNATSKNYPFHIIYLTTKGLTTRDKTIKPILDYLNDNVYYKQIQKEYLNNVKLKVEANAVMIAQIDALLKEYANESGTKSQSVYINENTQLNDVLKSKDELLREQGRQRIDLVGIDRIVKDISITANIKDEGSIVGKMKVVLPLLFIVIYLCVYSFRAFYRKQKLKHTTT